MDDDTSIGTPLYLMGLTYYKQVSDFKQTLDALYKQNTVSFFAYGLSKLSPLRNAAGAMQGSQVELAYPNVDMAFERMATAFNGTLHPDSGIPEATAENDWFNILNGDGSAEEHTVVNNFYKISDSASSVHLLHDTQINKKPMLTLTTQNFASLGATTYSDPKTGTQKTLAAWAGPDMWNQITFALTPSYGSANTPSNPQGEFAKVYITPGPVYCAKNAYEGIGAMIQNPGAGTSALISFNMLNAPVNGAWGYDPLPNVGGFWTASTASSATLDFGTSGFPSLSLNIPTTGSQGAR